MGAPQLAVLNKPQQRASEVPSFEEFDPRVIPWQYRAFYEITRADYSDGVHEFLFSGSVGSAKSILLAHLIIDHCTKYPRAKVGIGRESMQDLKDTLHAMILDHLEDDFVEGVDYKINGKSHIIFKNGSKITPFSWHDKRYKKFRSYSFSMFVIEELTENKTRTFYDEIKMRVGRATKIPFAAIICATNPDDPAHWAYDYFILGAKRNPKIHVYHSVTSQNPFLPKWYIKGLQETLDPKMARRMLKGEWLSLTQDKIYYAYDDDKNVIESYEIDKTLPIGMTWDFNIGVGKPMSMALFQKVGKKFVFFDEVVIHGSRTKDVMDELESRGYFDKGYEFYIYGDAAGKSNDTRSIKTDYDIIKGFLSNYEWDITDPKTGSVYKSEPIKFTYKVPLDNPPIRTRHNIVNGLLHNDLDERNLLVTKNCTTIRKGLQLTALKPGSDYVEDDSKEYQHVTTAIGYAAVRDRKEEQNGKTIVRAVH